MGFLKPSVDIIIFILAMRLGCDGGERERDAVLTTAESRRTLTVAKHESGLVEIRGQEITRFTRNTILNHSALLRDVSLMNVPRLEELESDCFADSSLLRSLYIKDAPLLKSLPPDLLNPAPLHFRSLRIIESGLLRLPELGPLADAGLLLHIVDFEGNMISKLDTRGLRVRSAQLILDNNRITEVEEFAFEGCELAELSLRGNQFLEVLHPNSFSGVVGIRELDLSDTSILFLPTVGLTHLEILRIENVISMKTIPSIYNFEKAHLTHHFHCCALNTPELHDPLGHTHFLQQLEKQRKLCLETTPSERKKRKREHPDSVYPQRSFDRVNKAFYDYPTKELDENSDPVRGEALNRDNGFEIDEAAEEGGEFLGTFHAASNSPLNKYRKTDFCGNFTKSRSSVRCFPLPDALNPCSDVLDDAGPRSVGWVTGTIAVTANLGVAAVLLARGSGGAGGLASQPLLQLQLVAADLCTSAYILLVAAADSYTAGEYFNFAYDWQYGYGCRIAGFMAVAGAQGSLLALAALTAERWLAIIFALRPQRRLTQRAARIVVLAALSYSLSIASLPLVGISDYSSTSICLPMRSRDGADTSYLGVLLLGGLASVLAVSLCYAHIYITLARDSRHCTVRRGEASVANKMAILIGTHMACCLPLGLAGAFALAGWPLIDVHGAKILLVLVYPLNAVADPFLYAILTHQFRRDLFLLLARYGICTKRAQQYKTPGRIEAQRHGIRTPVRGAGRGGGSLTTAYEDLIL